MARPPKEEKQVDDNLQVQNGNYTRIHNRILEELAKIHLSGYETRIIFALWRKTYGWQKKEDFISFKQFEELTRLPKSEVSRTLSRLKKRNLVVENYNSNRRIYRFNKHFTTWKELEKSTTSCRKLQQELEKSTTTDVETYNQKSPRQLKTQKQRAPKETLTKETLTKEISIENSQPQLSETKEESEALDRIMHHYNKAYPELPKLAGRQIVAWRGRARDWFHVGIFSGISEDEIHERIDKCPIPKHFEILPREAIDKAKKATRQGKERTGEIDRLLSKYEEYERTAVDAREGKERARSWRKGRDSRRRIQEQEVPKNV